ncbi:NAD(P)H-hydrate dehydratase [Candidatus Woesearchaeota archaeon]|nr:NAD(P)H-hydrate dehydratase [Candidatus Woesearchaeota archaeon]
MEYVTGKGIILPKRKKTAKKGDNGKVLVVGGSKDYAGAVALAGLAALRSGADWVTVAAPEKVAWAVNCLSPDLVTIKLKGGNFSARHAKEITNLSKNHDVVLIGNGIGLKNETKQFLKKAIKKINNLKVIDADGIKILSSSDLENSIITPHIKELEIFMKNSKIEKTIIEKIIKEKSIEKRSILIKNNLKSFFENNNIVLLKCPVDTIISKDKILFVKGGNPGMAKAGTGDVLAGLCAGFLGQSKELLQSAVNASYFNKLIGDILLKKKNGFTYLASDMVEEVKRVLEHEKLPSMEEMFRQCDRIKQKKKYTTEEVIEMSHGLRES